MFGLIMSSFRLQQQQEHALLLFLFGCFECYLTVLLWSTYMLLFGTNRKVVTVFSFDLDTDEEANENLHLNQRERGWRR